MPDSMVEIWQANAAGRYRHEEDDRADAPLDDSFQGFGRTGTDRDGAFRFHTVKPGPVPGLGNAWQAPHIVVCVFARGMLSHAYTRLYFSDEAEANAADPVLGSGRRRAPADADRRTGAEPGAGRSTASTSASRATARRCSSMSDAPPRRPVP